MPNSSDPIFLLQVLDLMKQYGPYEAICVVSKCEIDVVVAKVS